MNAYISDFEPGVSPMIHLAGSAAAQGSLARGVRWRLRARPGRRLPRQPAHLGARARRLCVYHAARACASAAPFRRCCRARRRAAARGNGTGGNGTAGVTAAFEPPLALSGWRGAWSSMRVSQAKRVSAAAAAVAAPEPALRDDLGDGEWLNRLVEAAGPEAHARLSAPTPADFALAPFARALGALEPRIAEGLERSRAEARAGSIGRRPAAGMAVARAAHARSLCSC